MRLVDFLNHGADQAGELRQFALQDRFAEIHVGQKAVQGVGQRLIGRRFEHGTGPSSPILRHRERQVFFGVEMMEEAAFGELSRLADVFNAGGGVALVADDVESRVEELGLGFVSGVIIVCRCITYRPVGTLSSAFSELYSAYRRLKSVV